MKKTGIFEKAKELKDKFLDFFQHRKKIQALDNLSACAPFWHKDYLSLLKNCLKGAFLDKEEAGFLDHLLTKYEISYLDWAHKTRWLKQQMAEKRQSTPRPVSQPQIFFDFEKQTKAPINIPIEIMASKTASRPIRRI